MAAEAEVAAVAVAVIHRAEAMGADGECRAVIADMTDRQTTFHSTTDMPRYLWNLYEKEENIIE